MRFYIMLSALLVVWAMVMTLPVASQTYPEPECEDYGTYVECEDDLINGKSYRPLIEPGSSGPQGNTVNTKTLPGQSSCLGQGLPNCNPPKTGAGK